MALLLLVRSIFQHRDRFAQSGDRDDREARMAALARAILFQIKKERNL